MRPTVREVPSCSLIVALRARQEANAAADRLRDERRAWVGWAVVAAALGAVVMGAW